MKKWYLNMLPSQKKFVWFVSLALILFFGVGLLPVAIFTYIELGERDKLKNNK